MFRQEIKTFQITFKGSPYDIDAWVKGKSELRPYSTNGEPE